MVGVRASVVLVQVMVSAVALACRLLVDGRASPQGRRILIGKAVAALLQRLGPTYVKCGQILASRRDLLRSDIIAELERLQDNTSPLRFDEIIRGRGDEIAAEIMAGFAHVDDDPLASGSVACVYRGVTTHGLDVAIKIRRPRIVRTVAEDVACLRAAARLLRRLGRLRDVPVVAVVEEVCSALTVQLDFEREAAMLRRLRTVFGGDRSVVLPQTVDGLCGPAVITMELLDQFRPDRRVRVGEDLPLREAARAALRALYRMIFVEGLIHCDLHGGNVRLQPDGRVAIVDFGLVTEMEPADRLDFAAFFYAVAVGDGAHCAAIVVGTAMSAPPDLAYHRFESEIVDLVAGVGRTPATFSVSRFVIRLFDIQRRYRVVGSPKFTSAILSLFVLEGILRQWLPDLDFQREAQRYIFLGSFPRMPADRPAVAS